MKDAEYEVARARILRSFYRWRRILGFAWWHCVIEYAREGIPPHSDDPKDWSCLAKCDAQWKYLRLRIEVNVPGLAKLTDAEIDEIMVHEFGHALVNELREERADWLDHEERVVTTLAKAIYWATEYGKDPTDCEVHVEEMMVGGIEDEKVAV